MPLQCYSGLPPSLQVSTQCVAYKNPHRTPSSIFIRLERRGIGTMRMARVASSLLWGRLKSEIFPYVLHGKGCLHISVEE